MTEAEWLACSDPWKMLKCLRNQKGWTREWNKRLFGWLGKKNILVNDRKLQMLVIAYCRHHHKLLTDERDKRALKISESYAEGLVGIHEVAEAIMSCSTFGGIGCTPSLIFNAAVACFIPHEKLADQSRAEYALERIQHAVALIAVSPDGNFTRQLSEEERSKTRDILTAEANVVVNLLHETIGNPFRPVTLNPSWLTSTVLALANGIYKERAFDHSS